MLLNLILILLGIENVMDHHGYNFLYDIYSKNINSLREEKDKFQMIEIYLWISCYYNFQAVIHFHIVAS